MMDNVREKLVELLESINAYAEEHLGFDKVCGGELIDFRGAEYIADHLIANGVTVQKWISVKDRLPDNQEHDWVLAQVVEDNGYMHMPKVMEYRQNRNDWYEETYGWLSKHNDMFTVTHWMPLPQPPKGVSEEALPVADEATERSVAVEKTEESASPKVLSGTANWR